MNSEPASRSACPPYERDVDVRHLLWELADGEGYPRLQEAAHKGLKGLRVAPFYGCQILRPSRILGFEDPDRPSSLERIIEACGGEAVDYPAKLKCCGFPIIQAREETALGELIQPIEQAIEAGADAIVTPCPLCHLSLDAWQSKLKATTGRDFGMPILHLSQLIGVAAGLGESELKFKRHVVPVGPVLEQARELAVDGESVISPDVVARYAADAAREVDGVDAVVEGVRKGIRVDGEEIELHLAFACGVSIPEVGAAVQHGVADYLERMTDTRPAAVNVVVEEVDEPALG